MSTTTPHTSSLPGWSFDTVLIANRGEIARRIIRTARRLGLRTVAVHSQADTDSPHVREADRAINIGPAPARDSYLNGDAVIAAALETGAGAIHPGYGFLSENASFARAVEAAGLAFVGPTPEQLESFGPKHTARALARAAGVPLMPGTGLLGSAEEAVQEARRVGLPVMLKATGGGGGIGMTVCSTEQEVADAYERVGRLAASNFASSGVFLERLVRPARHVEVQVIGDGTGRVAVLGDRDCSLQRRNQKVVEEAPAPGLSDELRNQLHSSAAALAASVSYRSAGTVEFVYDPHRDEASFLEVNTRLQVEHPVTEEVYGIDVVEQMLRLAGQGPAALDNLIADPPVARGHAVEARVYAENPNQSGRPSAGLITEATFPPDVRVDGWVETGTEVTLDYDPMLAKIIASGPTRDDALDRLGEALSGTRVRGVETNLGLLRHITALPEVRDVTHSTSTLNGMKDPEPRIEVLDAGAMTTVQDLPGRLGLWEIGVPPSGPMDDLSLREANLAVGNPESTPGLECTSTGPRLRFSHAAVACLTGAVTDPMVDGEPVAMWEPFTVPAGGVLEVGEATTQGLRSYLAVRGGFDEPAYLGSVSTFTLGRFGGHEGRALRPGDVLRPGPEPTCPIAGPTPAERRPALTNAWRIGVTEGPHAAPEFFTRQDMDIFYDTDYQVHFNSARTGVRLIGPHPHWAREDGGEAGLHPSNIHDTPYSVGSLDFTGDTPIILGPDGPSLGGFTCPAVVASTELWKVGQLRPGDSVRFVPVREETAQSLRARCTSVSVIRDGDGDDGVIARRDGDSGHPDVTYRRSGDSGLLIEYGDPVLDIGLRMRIHALQEAVREADLPGIIDLTPGIRSLQIHADPTRIHPTDLAGLMQGIEDTLPSTENLTVPSRTVKLPLSWDDPATRLAIERYMNSVRDDAPWCPWNIEFIRRVNGLNSVDDVYRTVFDASYLVLGLGDVYLGAPVATPIDPRHRLVTTKYNPARTWTAENSVGIGGAYMCIYGMEGPGGYQFVGRTIQVWNRFRHTGLFAEHPWSLRFFDRIQWYPVSPEELLDMRAEVAAGRGEVEITDGVFDNAEYTRFLTREADSIAAFKAGQNAAFEEEKDRWRASGEFDVAPEPEALSEPETVQVPEGCAAVGAPLTSNVWRIDVQPGEQVSEGQTLISLEAMKMEMGVTAPVAGVVREIYVTPGTQVATAQVLVAIEPDHAGRVAA